MKRLNENRREGRRPLRDACAVHLRADDRRAEDAVRLRVLAFDRVPALFRVAPPPLELRVFAPARLARDDAPERLRPTAARERPFERGFSPAAARDPTCVRDRVPALLFPAIAPTRRQATSSSAASRSSCRRSAARSRRARPSTPWSKPSGTCASTRRRTCRS